MLKFWKNIRKRLINLNKLKKYGLYAIGEILLVMIGILLALCVNNQNQIRIERNAEKQYLRSLKEEFTRNLNEANRVLNSCNSILESGSKLANWAGPGNLDVDDSSIEKNIAHTFAEPPKYIQSPGILNDLISSGNLNKIRSDQLRYLLQQWLAITKDVEDEENELWRNRFNVVDLMNKKISFKNLLSTIGVLSKLRGIDHEVRFNSDTQEILRDRYFENLLLFYLVNLNALNNDYYPRLKSNINQIINEIDRQLL